MAENRSSVHHTLQKSFLARASLPSTSPLAGFLYRLMGTKKSNLCLSADVTTTAELLQVADELGTSIVVLKTHADIIDDFGEDTIQGLTEIARRQKFLIFEDRKFGDIGSTVQKQYTSGPLRIAHWASIVNAHVFPGPDIVRALQSAAEEVEPRLHPTTTTEIAAGPGVGGAEGEAMEPSANETSSSSDKILSITTVDTRSEPMPAEAPAVSLASADGRNVSQTEGTHPSHKGLLLLAEMSSKGNLLTGAYTEQCVSLARAHRGFVMGFIAQRSLNQEPGDNFISMTPGVSLPPAASPAKDQIEGDGLGQQYNTPRTVVLEQGSDIIIVGRGILHAEDRKAEAERYRYEGWHAYEERLARCRRRAV